MTVERAGLLAVVAIAVVVTLLWLRFDRHGRIYRRRSADESAQRIRKHQWRRLVNTLEELGFFADLAPDRVPVAKAKVIEAEFPFAPEGLNRQFFADAEDLAEGGVGVWIKGLAVKLSSLGLRIDEAHDDYREGTYTVRINGREWSIFGPGEHEGEASGENNAWELASQRSLALLNTLLAEFNSKERVYWGGGAEDGWVAFLTPAMMDLLVENGLMQSTETVFKPRGLSEDSRGQRPR